MHISSILAGDMCVSVYVCGGVDVFTLTVKKELNKRMYQICKAADSPTSLRSQFKHLC